MTAITGNTYPVKDKLKAMGARWNADAKAWMVPDEKADAARALVGGNATATPMLSDEEFFTACMKLDSAALANDPRAKAFDRKMARREASFYRED